MSRVRASVPGKLILMGEHAAVYGRPAIVTTIGLYARVSAQSLSSPEVRISLPDLDFMASLDWPELAGYAERARAAWDDYAAAPTPERFTRVARAAREGVAGSDDLPPLEPAHLVLTALGEIALARRSEEPPGIALEVISELPVGAGFGSSAAIAVGVLAAASQATGRSLGNEALARLALEVERRQHGFPSGADHTTVLSGGVQCITRVSDDPRQPSLDVESLAVPPATLSRFSIFSSGRPEAGTGEVVASVRALREQDPPSFDRRLDRMAENVLSFARELVRDEPDWSRLGEVMIDYQICLEEIGVVPGAVRQALARARAAGFAAKVSGAGGLSDAGAGSVVALGAGELPASLAAYSAYAAELGVAGLTLEVEA